MIKIYNTLTRKKEKFVPLEAGKVKMYVCGPTVYNYIHIGNARSTVAFDTIRRYLEYRGYAVHYVSNFTDVDDRIIKTAHEEKISPKELADKFIAAFHDDTARLNVKPACEHPRVVDYMEEIIAFVVALIDKGYAYEASGDVYFRTRKFADYGKLSDQSVDELEIGASNRTGAEQALKEDPLDFALWKHVKANEISWSSPWGEGRPGWHIECSVMVTELLGETIDIHAGGEDLQFPHHENEIAQSEARSGKTFSNYWMHNGYVTVGDGGAKMSKSLGNFVTARELLATQDPQSIRFALATTQYRRPIPFNATILADARHNLSRIKTAYDNVNFRQKDSQANLADDAGALEELAVLKERFITEMDDDFNAANGITVVYELVKWLNSYSQRVEISAQVSEVALTLLNDWLAIFGITLKADNVLLDEAIDGLIGERDQARLDKNFARSDEIRDYLKAEGILLEDTPQGTRWRRTE